MKLRLTAMLLAVPAMVVGVLLATPAEAASYNTYLKTRSIAIMSDGTGKVMVTCKGRSTCTGTLSFSESGAPTRPRAYRVSGGKSAYVKVAVHTTADGYPYNSDVFPGRDFRSAKTRLKVSETSPHKNTHYYDVTTETYRSSQEITGKVTAKGGNPAEDVRVDLIRRVKGGNTQIVSSEEVDDGGTYSFTVRLGTNNASSSYYRLKVSGKDERGIRRSWYWRGTDGSPTGGGISVDDASAVRGTKYEDFNADFVYGYITGKTSKPSTDVVVASPPGKMSSNKEKRRELDLASCANIFGAFESDSNGFYRINFLPITSSQNNRYVIGAKNGSVEAWYGKTATRYGSCVDAMDYEFSRRNLITLTDSLHNQNPDVSLSGNDVHVNGMFSSAYKPTAQGDRWIRLRERVPGLPILETPVVAEGMGNSSGNRVLTDVPPGNYWVEVGRRTGCSDWYPSKYTNNRAYFRGDRAGETWRSFTKLSHLQGNASTGMERRARTASPNPATGAEQNKIRSGYKGWMYRAYCKAYGAGTINKLNVNGTGDQYIPKTTSRNPQGAVVKGRVTRAGGKTNKEILVRLSSSAGTRVVRTDITDGSGRFYVAGLASGTWTITVNSDSWRGIGRTHTGRHSITVKAGRGYNAGTLRFKN